MSDYLIAFLTAFAAILAFLALAQLAVFLFLKALSDAMEECRRIGRESWERERERRDAGVAP